MNDLVHGGVVPCARSFDVIQRLLQAFQFDSDLLLGLLGILDSDLFETLNGLDLLGNINRFGRVGFHVLLDLVNHSGVLEQAAVVAEVDGGWLFLEDLQFTASFVISLLEVGES